MNFYGVFLLLMMSSVSSVVATGPLYKFFQRLVDTYNKRRLEVTTEMPETTAHPRVPTNGSIYQVIVDNEPVKWSQTGNYNGSTFLNYPNFSIIQFVYNNGDEAKDEKFVGQNNQIQRFPPFLEYFVQRIQAYFSTYKYEDQSRPVRVPIIVNNDGMLEIAPLIGLDLETSTDQETTTDSEPTTEPEATNDPSSDGFLEEESTTISNSVD